MHFTTTLLSIALIVAGTTAAPNDALEDRQVTDGFFFIQYFTEPDCQGTLINANGWLDNGSNQCRLPQNTFSYPSWRVRQNFLQRPVNVYSNADCSTSNGGDVVAIAPNQFGCFTQHVGSVKFGPA